MTRVAAVIMAPDAAGMERQAKAALSRGADLVELRLDHLARPEPAGLRRLAKAVGSRAIATLRSPGQGGRAEAPGGSRRTLLQELARLRFLYLDVERDADAEAIEGLRREAKRNGTTVIVSHHFLQPVEPAEVADALDACAALGDVAKVAAPVEDPAAALALVDLARRRRDARRRSVVIGMGAAGMLTRALAEDAGQEIQYASFDVPSAPGQLSLATAVRLRGRAPIVLGIAGRPLGHSISPAIHEAAFAAAKVPAVYLPFDVAREDLAVLLDAPDRLRLRGFNVTIPHKEAVAGLVDELDGDAEALGAVNTVVVADGWTKGHNTDVYGFRMALRSSGVRMGGRTALVLGAGGAAKAVVHVLLREGARVQVASRTAARAEALADAFDGDVEVRGLGDLERGGPWDLLVNATPLGTRGHSDASPAPDAVVARSAYVVDLVYNPPETPLLRAARRAGVPGTSGLGMLLHQAAKAYELWLGAEPPIAAMEAAAKEALR